MKNTLSFTLFSILASSSRASASAVAEKPPEAEDGTARDQECVASADGECAVDRPTSVYVIGDLHGDATCAVSWVNRTGLVADLLDEALLPVDSLPLHEKLSDPSAWKWTRDGATLVFLGNYVDQGPTARQTLEFVKNLTARFPDAVAALLGDHELLLLRDRDARVAPADRHIARSQGAVHPGEYHNYFNPKQSTNSNLNTNAKVRSLDEKDDLVLDLLYEAAMEVYASKAHSAVRFVPSLDRADPNRRRGVRFAITDIVPPQHRALATERLAEYVDAYLGAFRSGAALGDWLERRPMAHAAEDVGTMFVHDGLPKTIGKLHSFMGKRTVHKLNSVWWKYSREDKLYDFLDGEIVEGSVVGYLVRELLTYGGDHPDDDTDENRMCETLRNTLAHMEGIDRIAVGHAPGDGVRIMCDGALLALDSTLGRWVRGSGGEYCPGPEHFENRKGKDIPRTSRDGRYRCEDIKEVCEGQIVRLDSDGSVNIITM